MKRLAALAAFAVLAVAQVAELPEVRLSAHAYTPPQLRLTAQAQLVPLEVVVRDAHGLPVAGLKQSEFEILDEGKARAIAGFSVETRSAEPWSPAAPAASGAAVTGTKSAAPTQPQPPPRSTMLFFDDVHASSAELRRTQTAAKRFISDGMGPGAWAAVYSANQGLTLDFTTNAAALTEAIDKLRSHPHMSENGLQPCPRITPFQAYLIANNLDVTAYNAALAEANQCTGQTPTNNPIPKRQSMVPSNPIEIDVRAQAEATWQQAREVSYASFDAIGNAMGQLAKAPGTRVLLMVSTGFLSGMLDAERDAAIDRAIHAGIVINALDAKGLWSEGATRPFGQEARTYQGFPIQTYIFEATTVGERNDMMNDVMAQFASATGGLFFHNSNDLTGGFAQLGAVPQTTYLLAFRPDAADSGKYHKLKVHLTGGGHGFVQTRPGYLSPAPSTAAATETRKLDTEAAAADTRSEIPVNLAGRLGASEVVLAIHVDLSNLKFTERSGRQTQRLQFIGELMDAQGNIVTAKEGSIDMAWKPENFARKRASGISAELSLAAPPGAYRVRVVVQDAEGKLAAVNETVEIPR